MTLLRLVTNMVELFILDPVMFMIYLFQNLIIQLPNYSTARTLKVGALARIEEACVRT